jgi:uncharacterized membrane protein (DUF485 family)
MVKTVINEVIVDDSVIFKQKLGIVLCIVYAVVYAGFVVISVYDVTVMDIRMPFGLNLATFYGLGLIAFALLLALSYNVACTASERSLRHKEGALSKGDRS